MNGSKLDRRTFVKLGGLGVAVGAGLLTPGSTAQRGPTGRARIAAAPPPRGQLALPPLPVLALSRLAFGPSPRDLEAFAALPGKDDAARLDAHLDAQLYPEKIDDQACDVRLAAAGLDTLGKSLEQLWQEHYVKVPEGEGKYPTIWRPTQHTRAATLVRAVHSRRQLFEVVVGFWHDHFNVNPDKDERIPPGMVSYDRDVIRRHALGNFRALLGAVAHSPAMLYYLDNASSTRAGPNENYARELFELHTLGAEHYLGVGRQSKVQGYAEGRPVGYVDDDVYEATRAFTGWRVDDDKDERGLSNTGRFIFQESAHDRFQKTILGRYLPPGGLEQDGELVLDALARHPGTATFIARKLTRKLIADDPPERVVREAAQVFLNRATAPDQLRQVIGTIVRSDEFRSTWGQKIKRPFEATAATLRAVQAEFTPNDDFLWTLFWMGQQPFDHRPPNGYPDVKGAWNGSLAMLRRWQLARSMAHGWNDHLKVDLLGATLAELHTPAALADFWMRRLLGRPLPSPAARQVISGVLAWGGDVNAPIGDQERKDRLPDAVAFIIMSPEFQAS